jgi:hypothetical protein
VYIFADRGQEAFVLIPLPRLFIGTLLGALATWSAHAALPDIQRAQLFEPQHDDGSFDDDHPTPVDFAVDVDMYDNVAIVGAPEGNDGIGHAAIFVRDSSGQWSRTINLAPNDGKPGAAFGTRVALLNGKAVVASRTAIYLFVRQSNGAWLQKDERTFAGASSVSDLDWQGNLLVVGVLGDAYPNYAFAYDTSQTNTLRKIARFAPGDALKSDAFGTRVAAYGTTIVATAPGYNNKQGAAYVYSCGTSACTQTQKIISIGGKQGDYFGASVDMNGAYLVIGASGVGDFDEYDGGRQGSAYVFTPSGKAWAQVQTLHPTAEEFANYGSFGTDLTIQGSRLIVGSPYGGLSYEGCVFEYVLQGTQWTARAVLDWSTDGFGASTSLIGKYAIIGQPWSDHAYDSGGVAFYTLP